MSAPTTLHKQIVRLLSQDAPAGNLTAPASMVEAVRVAIRAKHAQRRRRTVVSAVGFLAAVAASLLLVDAYRGAQRSAKTQPLPLSNVGTATYVAVGSGETRGREIQPGDQIVTNRDARAQLSWPSGTRLECDQNSSLRVVEQGPALVFSLGSGSVQASVAKLAKDERFVVRTDDAEVEVRGTRFRVSRTRREATCGDYSTRVEVTEGVVAVRARGVETLVHAGETWPTCPSSDPSPEGPSLRGTTAVTPPTPSTPPIVPTTLPLKVGPVDSSSSRASALASQNDLFSEAMAARRSGDNTRALKLFDTLLDKHPTGPLAENAAVERLQLLAATGSPRAKNAANQYLRRYPNGYARSIAESIEALP